MECAVYGLPVFTVVAFIGVPLLIAAFLVWWGLTYKPSDEKKTPKNGGTRS
jgi:hypothetical protein